MLRTKVKVHIHERAKLRTKPHNVTNSYVWTIKTRSLSTNQANHQTIQGNPFFVSFSVKHKEIRGDVWTTISTDSLDESEEIYAA